MLKGTKDGEVKQSLPIHVSKNTLYRTKLKNEMIENIEREVQGKASGLTCISLPVKQKLCMDMLAHGKPKAFIEFFNLTHSTGVEEMSNDKDKDIKESPRVLPPNLLSELSANLVEAELAKRTGDAEKLSHINFSIGSIFEKFEDFKKAVSYYSKSLLNSKQAQHLIQEAEVKFSLGKVMVKSGDCFNAISWFEEYLQFAHDTQNDESLTMGAKHLLEVYQMSADKARKDGNLEKSLFFYEKSIQMAELCGNDRAKAEAKHEIAVLHHMLSRLELSLQYQTEYLDFCCKEDNKVGQSKAHAALAETQETMGNTELAIQHLEALLEVSRFVNLKTQATACCKLGMMYKKQNLYGKALTYFEMFFKMACTLKDPKLIDAARVDLGFVRNALARSDTAAYMVT